VLGVVGRGHNVSDFARRIFPWVWLSLAVNLVTGFIMFAGDATAYVPARAFQFKILVVLLAIVFGMIVQWKIPGWGRSPVLPMAATILAIVSLLFWVGAILMGVEVPALSGVG